MGLSMVPTVFLMLVPVLRNMDPAFEEASMIAGASRFMTLLRVTFPLTYPAFFAALIWFFIISIEAFEIPGVIGMQAGILVFSTKIFWAIHPPMGELPEYGTASALAMSVLVLSGVLVYLYLKVLGAGEKYTTVTGRGYRPAVIDLGRARYAGSGFFIPLHVPGRGVAAAGAGVGQPADLLPAAFLGVGAAAHRQALRQRRNRVTAP